MSEALYHLCLCGIQKDVDVSTLAKRASCEQLKPTENPNEHNSTPRKFKVSSTQREKSFQFYFVPSFESQQLSHNLTNLK